MHETRSFNRYLEEAQGSTHASLENPPRPPGSHSLFAAWPSALARDLTFIATSDSHCITDDQSERNRSIRLSIEEMNAIDQRTWPEALGGGTIPRPRAVFINGDIINDGDKRARPSSSGVTTCATSRLNGKDGLLK